MAEDDKRISGLYRSLPKEEPPGHLDAAILAASRRAGLRRWALPISVAAVVVLSATVTLLMQREQADYAPPAEKPAPRVEEKAVPQKEIPLRAHPGAAQRDAVTGVVAPKPAARPLQAPRPETPSPSSMAGAMQRSAPAAAEESLGKLEAGETPEKWLERIAELRCKGRGREAEEETGAFRKRYPDTRIPEAKPCQ